MSFVLAVAALLAAIALAWVWQGSRTKEHPDETAATTKDDAGAEWQAEVELDQLSETQPDYERKRLKIVLRNAKGKETETPEVSFELNGQPLEYRVSQGNYYDRHPYYRLREDNASALAADTDYTLALRRNQNTPSSFARLRTPAPMSPAQFELPVRHASHRDLVFTWKGLRQQADLLIYKTHTLSDGQGNQSIEAGGPYAVDALRHRIGPNEQSLREGRYVIPASYLAASAAGDVTRITIEVEAANRGQFLHPVLKGSTLTAKRKIVFRVEVVEGREK
ncbi:hypothetical protein BURK2_03723 [Burkholderiales bacterium]|nr:MAG: hypothetical protein F9K47_13655 [Burkholderiales bacterium]CAG1008310.1 hypothetical protein BURK2_03723 [Burkholderiales bacterium]